jgi:hypothetical protein
MSEVHIKLKFVILRSSVIGLRSQRLDENYKLAD